MRGPAKIQPAGDAQPKKRQAAGPQDDLLGCGRPNKRAKARADRNIPVHASASDAVSEDGDVNLPLFLEALQSSIGGLEKAMRKSKASGTKRAFQQVPRDMRRRTASHNPKRVPGRLRARAQTEMVSDNTPLKGKKKPKDTTVWRALGKVDKARRALRKTLKETEETRKVLHLRATAVPVPATQTNNQTSKESRCLKAQYEHLSNALDKTRQLAGQLQVPLDSPRLRNTAVHQESKHLKDAMTRTKKLNIMLLELQDPNQQPDLSEKLGKALVKTKKLNKTLAKVKQPVDGYNSDLVESEKDEDEDKNVEMCTNPDDQQARSLAPGRKNISIKDRQLPTHLWHAKRANMSTSDNPFYSKPTPINMNTKTVRKIHRAYNASAFMRDVSHRGFVQVSGQMSDVKATMEALGIDCPGATADWVRGCRVWTGTIRFAESGSVADITPARAIWNPSITTTTTTKTAQGLEAERQVLIEVEPDTAELVIRTLTSAAADRLGDSRSQVTIRDLSDKFGCIDLLGPGSGQRLVQVLLPANSPNNPEASESAHWRLFRAIAEAQPSMLGYNVVMGLMIRYPAKSGREDGPTTSCSDIDEAEQLLAAQEDWATEASPQPLALLNQAIRRSALKSIESKQAAARNPSKSELYNLEQSESLIPILLLCSASKTCEIQGKWTIICQRELVKPLWLRLCSQKGHLGGEMEIACAEEMHRIHTEQAVKFFPIDFPHTVQGTLWEFRERARLQKEWDARPKGKRPNWATLDLGGPGGKGEHGDPYACDWEHLLRDANLSSNPESSRVNGEKTEKEEENFGASSLMNLVSTATPRPLAMSVSSAFYRDFFEVSSPGFSKRLSVPALGLSTVRISMFAGGVPRPRARVYLIPRLAEHRELKDAWLKHFRVTKRATQNSGTQKSSSDRRFPNSSTIMERKEILAAKLFRGTDCEAAAGGERSPLQQHLRVLPGDLMGYVTSGGYNLAKGKGHGIGHLAAAKIVESMQTAVDEGRSWNGLESFYCIVRNVGETTCRPAVWRFVEQNVEVQDKV